MQVIKTERYLRREKRTVTKWIADIVDQNGKRSRPEFDSRKEAADEVAKYTLLRKKGKTRREEQLLEDHPVRTLRELLEFHTVNVMAHWKPKSVTDWKPRAQCFIDWCEGQGIMYAHQVTKKIALAYTVYVQKEFKRKSIDLRISAANAIFHSEIEFSEPPCINRNPFTGIRKSGYYKRTRPKLVTQEHLNAFLSCCPEFEYHLFRLEYSGGFRSGEIQNLTWRQINGTRITIGDHESWEAKTQESMGLIRWNNLIAESLAWFRLRSGNKKYVVDSHTFMEHQGRRAKIPDRVGSTFIGKRFNRVKAVASERYPEFDWENFSPHKLRGAYGSHLAELGVPLIVIKEAMRHANQSTTDYWYINVAPAAVDHHVLNLSQVRLAPYNPAFDVNGSVNQKLLSVKTI